MVKRIYSKPMTTSGMALHGCHIVGWGRSNLPVSMRMDNQEFIRRQMTEVSRQQMRVKLNCPEASLNELCQLGAVHIQEATGIVSRGIFPGETHELGLLAARDALDRAGWLASDIDGIVVGTNTNERFRYPSTADRIGLGLEIGRRFVSYDVQEACTSGLRAMSSAARGMMTGEGTKVLAIGVDRASQLGDPDDYLTTDLFADGSMAVAFEVSAQMDILYQRSWANPFNGLADLIKQTAQGTFIQKPSVRKPILREVPEAIVSDIAAAGIEPSAVRAVVLHQPSLRILIDLEVAIKEVCPDLASRWFPRNITTEANMSCAGAGYLAAGIMQSGLFIPEDPTSTLEPGDIVVVVSFGSGISYHIIILQYWPR